jgi:hypothetical protein
MNIIICRCLRLSVCLSVCLFVCLSVCLFVCLSVCLFVCLSVCLFVTLSIYFSNCLSDLRQSVCLFKIIDDEALIVVIEKPNVCDLTDIVIKLFSS